MSIINNKTNFKNKYSFVALTLILLVVIGCSTGDANKVTETKVENTNAEQRVEKTKPAEKNGFSDEDLAGVFKAKKEVGKFKRVKVSFSSDPAKKLFKNSTGEALAMYMGKSKEEGVMYVLASYTSQEKAKEEFRNFIEREKESGAKMLVDVTEDPVNKSINANYKKGKVSIISFCSWQLPQVTMCHSMASPDNQTTVNFHDSWFSGK